MRMAWRGALSSICGLAAFASVSEGGSLPDAYAGRIMDCRGSLSTTG